MLKNTIIPILFFLHMLFTGFIWVADVRAFGAAYFSIMAALVLVLLQQLVIRESKANNSSPVIAAIFPPDIGFTCKLPRQNSKYLNFISKHAEYSPDGTYDLLPKKKQKPRNISKLFVCQLILVSIPLVLASVNIILKCSWDKKFYPGASQDPDEIELLIPIFENAETRISVKCSGIDTDKKRSTVVFLHGYSAQGLAFAWGYEKLRNETLVCLFDRVGTGFSRNLHDVDPETRTSEQFAYEFLYVFDQLHVHPSLVGRFDRDNLVFVAASFSGMNVRALEIVEPGISKGIVFVDPVHVETSSRCAGGPPPEIEHRIIYERVIDSGVGLVASLLEFKPFSSQLDYIPSRFREEMINDKLLPDYFSMNIYESNGYPKNCKFIREGFHQPYNFSITSIIAEHGLFKRNLTVALEIEKISVDAKTVFVPGAEHTELLSVEANCDIVIQETLLLLDRL
eukprot:snap_masked-scaffold_74-processed-gene-0.52-mRNA-1 protein AED:1.00 eAED:1.00 QI:0/0/0/0/1/1/3/0/453